MNLVPKIDKKYIFLLGAYVIQAISGVALLLAFLFSGNLSGFGSFSVLYALFVVLGQFATLGIPEALMRYADIRRADNLNDGVQEGIIAVNFFSIPISLIFIYYSSAIKNFFPPIGSTSELIFIFSALPLLATNKVLSAALNVRSRYSSYSFLLVARSVLLASISCFWLVLSSETLSIGLIFFIVECAVLLLAYLLNFREIKFLSCSIVKSLSMLRFGCSVVFYSVMTECIFKLDLLIVSSLLTAENFGRYAIANFLLEGVLQFAYVLRIANIPQLKTHVAQTSLGGVTFTRKLGSYAVMLCSIVSLFSILALEVLKFLGGDLDRKLDGIISIIAPVLLGAVIYSYVYVRENTIYLSGKPKLQSLYLFLNCGIMLAVLYPATYYFGEVGASVGLMIILFLFVLNYYTMHKVFVITAPVDR